MTASHKILILSAVCLLAIFTVITQLVTTRERTIIQNSYNTNAGELTRDALIGQTFKAERDNLSGIAVMFATYSNRANTEPIFLHVRQALDAKEDIRTATINPDALGDNQLYRFNFEPIPDSKDKSFFFFVVSPQSTPHNAVTVDLSTSNPYHLGSAFVVRGQGSNITDPVIIARSGKVTWDLGFATYHTVPLRVALINAARHTYYTFIITWEERRGDYLLLVKAAAPAVLFLIVLITMSRRQRQEEDTAAALKAGRYIPWLLSLLLLVAILLRVLYSLELPITDDEGNYLYDARSLRQGILAGGDGYVKAPIVIAWIALWQMIIGDTIMAGRLSSIIIGALTLFPIYSIARHLKDHFAGIIAAASWALFGAAVVSNIYVHTQAFALFLGVSGIALLLSTLQESDRHSSLSLPVPLPKYMPSTWHLIAAGMLLGLAVASRKSILALGLVPLLIIVVYSPSWRLRWRACLQVGVGFLLIIGLFLGFATYVYGELGFWEALGFNSAEDGAVSLAPSEIEQVRSYSLRGMTPFFRESLPFILLSLVSWGLLLENLTRMFLHHSLRQKPTSWLVPVFDHLIPKLPWVAPLAVFWWCFNFFFEYEGSLFMFYGMPALWYGMGATLVLLALWPRSQAERLAFTKTTTIQRSTQPGPASLPNTINRSVRAIPSLALLMTSRSIPLGIGAALILPVWIGGLVFFYSNWIKFHANYISEFLPPLAITTGLGALLLWQRLTPRTSSALGAKVSTRIARMAVVIIVVWSISLSNFITFNYKHTGTLEQSSAQEAATWARINIPLDEPIFTGAATIPYLSGHHTVLDIAHPRWYAYEFTRQDPQRLNTFLPPIAAMLEAYRRADWFLLDKQTGFSYLMEYSEIEAGLERDFEAMAGIENGSNTLTFYRRVNRNQ